MKDTELLDVLQSLALMEKERKEESYKHSLEYNKSYKQNNYDKILESKKKYYNEHKDELREKSRKYYNEHKDELNAKRRNQRKKDPKYFRDREKRYRLNKKKLAINDNDV